MKIILFLIAQLIFHVFVYLSEYFAEEMKNKEIIDSKDQIKVTEKGKQFHKDYSKINELIQELSIQN